MKVTQCIFSFTALNETCTLDYRSTRVSPVTDSIHHNYMNVTIENSKLNVNLPPIPQTILHWCKFVRDEIKPDGLRTKYIPECMNKHILDICDLVPNYLGNHFALTKAGKAVLLFLDNLSARIDKEIGLPIITGPFSIVPRMRGIFLQRIFLVEGLTTHPDMSSIDNVEIGNTTMPNAGRSTFEPIEIIR